jgi:tetratricopeptide (TPR) repeat protein
MSVQRNWQGDFDGAIEMCRESEAAARDLRDGFNEAFSMSNRAFAHIGRGDHREAHELIVLARQLARERDNLFILGRLTNTLGWLYQEFGDFARARELDQESADLAGRIKNGNVEISALINLGFDDLQTGAPDRALPRFQQTLERAEKAFGAHRWRWAIHLSFGIASSLIALGRDAEALAQAERGLATATSTGSRKYVGWFHALRGEVALRAGDAPSAVAELTRALDVARAIRYPTLTWQAAHRLAEARAAAGDHASALAAAQLAHDTLAHVAAAAPEPDLRRTLAAWPRAAAVQETLGRLRRGA